MTITTFNGLLCLVEDTAAGLAQASGTRRGPPRPVGRPPAAFHCGRHLPSLASRPGCPDEEEDITALFRTFFAIAGAALLAGCALPPDTALRDWARLASVLADRPSAVAAEPAAARDVLHAQQGAVAAYLYALSVLAEPETPLTFRMQSFATLEARAATADPAAGEAVARLGMAMQAARAGNLAPDARAMSAGSAVIIEDLRLVPFIRSGDPPLQVLAASLARGTRAGPEGVAYRQVLRSIAEAHAMLAGRGLQIRQREVSRDILARQDGLRRLALSLPPDPVVAARRDPSGGIAAAVLP